MPIPLILASRSEGRATLLRQAGVPFETVPAALDEAAVKAAMLAEAAPPRDVADMLADLKARRVAAPPPRPPVPPAGRVPGAAPPPIPSGGASSPPPPPAPRQKRRTWATGRRPP